MCIYIFIKFHICHSDDKILSLQCLNRTCRSRCQRLISCTFFFIFLLRSMLVSFVFFLSCACACLTWTILNVFYTNLHADSGTQEMLCFGVWMRRERGGLALRYLALYRYIISTSNLFSLSFNSDLDCISLFCSVFFVWRLKWRFVSARERFYDLCADKVYILQLDLNRI